MKCNLLLFWTIRHQPIIAETGGGNGLPQIPPLHLTPLVLNLSRFFTIRHPNLSRQNRIRRGQKNPRGRWVVLRQLAFLRGDQRRRRMGFYSVTVRRVRSEIHDRRPLPVRLRSCLRLLAESRKERQRFGRWRKGRLGFWYRWDPSFQLALLWSSWFRVCRFVF